MPVMDLPCVTIPPSAAQHTHTVVFLHGRGDTAANFAGSLAHSRDSRGRSLPGAFPSFRWVFPQAPARQCASEPGQVWHQWFDVWSVRDFSEREELQGVGLRESVPAVRELLAREAAALGRVGDESGWRRVVLAGISMGAATGAHVLFNLDVPQEGGLGAFLGFSCRCPFAGRTLEGMREALGLEDVPPASRNTTLRTTPVLLEHCADDPLVLVQNGRRMRDILREFGARVEWREYPAGGHWFNSPTGMDDVVDFLRRQVLQASSLVPVQGVKDLDTKENDTSIIEEV